jgi:hypothetical protein
VDIIFLGTYEAHTKGEVQERFVDHAEYQQHPFVVTKIIWNKNIPERHGYRTYNLYGYKKDNIQELIKV